MEKSAQSTQSKAEIVQKLKDQFKIQGEQNLALEEQLRQVITKFCQLKKREIAMTVNLDEAKFWITKTAEATELYKSRMANRAEEIDIEGSCSYRVTGDPEFEHRLDAFLNDVTECLENKGKLSKEIAEIQLENAKLSEENRRKRDELCEDRTATYMKMTEAVNQNKRANKLMQHTAEEKMKRMKAVKEENAFMEREIAKIEDANSKPPLKEIQTSIFDISVASQDENLDDGDDDARSVDSADIGI